MNYTFTPECVHDCINLCSCVVVRMYCSISVVVSVLLCVSHLSLFLYLGSLRLQQSQQNVQRTVLCTRVWEREKQLENTKTNTDHHTVNHCPESKSWPNFWGRAGMWRDYSSWLAGPFKGCKAALSTGKPGVSGNSWLTQWSLDGHARKDKENVLKIKHIRYLFLI